ncbi:hypothetical protein INT45_010772 [Circinella minor]|uniref:DNA repair protein SWI5 homolog n=1 Tax=Circinella minor TaxID=1195481 RepID=A0A8H7RX45_9FUNG|nr:hypothetical protein INT45_010772 [Circinella minor]
MDKKKKQIQDLRLEYEVLSNELQMNEKEASQMLQQRIRLLHEYNDLKDTATMLIGMYAQKTGKTLQEVYEQFNINSNMDE